MTKVHAALVALVLCSAATTRADTTVSASAASACDRQMVMQINSAKITADGDGFTIDAFGTSESAGWKDVTITFAGRTGEMAAVDFVACRPEVSAQVLTPVQTRAKLDLGTGVRQIVIRAKRNTMTVDITQH